MLTGMLFILQTGLRWDLLPREMGCGSGMSCWRGLMGLAGCRRLGPAARSADREADLIDWFRVVVESSSIRAVGAGQTRTESHRPHATWFQAPPQHRSAGHPARGNPHRRPPPRCHPASHAG